MQHYFSILKNKYDQSTFQKFAHELLNDIEIGKRELSVDSSYESHIESFIYLGSFTDNQGKNLHILDVALKTNTKIEQARTMQRNLIARYLKEHWLDGALVAFHNDNSTSWRLSFVKVEYKYNENGKPIEELTPAKRYSFLVGEGEPSHTAQTQLAKIYELTSQNPTLAQLEEAFSVEKVTKEFFEKYRDLFESVVAELKSSHTFQNEASKNNIDTESFAKKLLGQIVFLYFLQKKGWLGVPKGKSWGEGDKMFLRNIYNEAIAENKNFFNNYLEVLFYDTLNNARNDKVDRNYSDFFQSKVPFLNGGLFEPQYDWKSSLMFLDNKLFDKILGVFDTYNFTVKEDEPLEKEVAVDPEMLGKVFENLLEENLRKGKGTYYTPREIVHYMCEESIVNFLATETNQTPEDIKNKYFPAYNKLGEDIEFRDVSISEKIIESLKNIKVVDPACGSGAFLVGMLQQITQLRNDLETRSKLLGRREVASTEYEIKKQTIQNCIYGVDIDPGAIEIAKLRLWLSLVVDYDLEQIEPLPNLDYKLMQGNSLLEELVLGDTSIKLYDSEGIKKVMGSKRMKNLFDQENQIGLFDGDNDKVMKSLKSLQLKYFSTSDSESKKKIRNQIEKIEHDLIETSVKSSLEDLKNQKYNVRIMPGIGILPEDIKRLEKISSKENQIFAVLEELKKTGTKPFFLWHLYFSDVFEEKGGFDIVIANPPYVEFKKLQRADKQRIEKYYLTAKGKYDLYVTFIELAINLLSNSGNLAFINPTMFMKRDYGEELRKFILHNSKILKILDFSDIQIFDSATNYTGVFFISKANTTKNHNFLYRKYKDIGRKISVDEFNKSLDQSTGDSFYEDIDVNSEKYGNEPWIFNTKVIETLLAKMRNNSKSLGELIEDFFEGIASGKDEVFYVTQDVIEANNIEKQMIYPLLRGIDVKKYCLNWSGTYVIYPYDDNGRVIPEDELKQDFPNCYSYLVKSRGLLSDREYFNNSNKKWYEIWNPRDIKKLKQPRIVTPEISQRNNFAFCDGFFGNTKTYNLLLINKNIDEYLYILGLLNSSLIEFYYKHLSVPKAGGYIEYKKQFLTKIPIKLGETQIRERIIGLVRQIQNENLEKNDVQDEVEKKQKEIDQIVYSLYEITDDEIRIIEKGNRD